MTAQITVGIAPRQVVLIGSTAYVANVGGRPAKPVKTLSADGHNWLMQADANDYIETSWTAPPNR